MKRQFARCILIAIGLVGCLPSPMVLYALAQSADLDWEHIGKPIEGEDLDIAGAQFFVLDDDSLYLLINDFGELEGQHNVVPGVSHLLAVSSDTLFTSTSGSTHRSTDGGKTWPVVFTEGGELFASDLDGPNGGALLTRIDDSTGVGYSHDRGASWHRAEGLETSTTPHRCTSFEEIRAGPFVGRLIAGCLAGMAYSDDRGANWNLSNVWVDFTYNGVSIITAQNGVLYARLEDPEPGFGLWSSSDGAMWTRVSTIPSSAHLVGVEGGPAPEGVFYAVGRLTGEVHRSLDAGQTWEELSDVYDGPENITVNSAIVGPDDRLYVGVTSPGVGPQPYDGVYRTTESVIVSNEPEAPPIPTAERLIVYPNPAADWLTVETNGDGEEVLLHDLLGRVVSRARLSFGKASLDVSRLPAGAYVVRVGTHTQRITLVK